MEENISEALLMAASVLIFVIALTLIFSMFSQAKTTADAVLYSYDDTQYYTDDLEGITFTVSEQTNREVGIETIVPTAYRYVKEHYGVTIIDGNKIVARFDETTESIVRNWPSYLRRNPTKCEDHYTYLKEQVFKPAGIDVDSLEDFSNYNSLTNLWQKIYYAEKSSGNTAIKYNTPWLGTDSLVAKRLDVDFGGGVAEYSDGKHIVNKGLLERYANKKFEEIYVFVSDDSGTETDPDSGDSVVIKSNTTKLEIIYKVK